MRCPAAIPAIGLCAGIPAGIFVFSVPSAVVVCLWLSAAYAFVAHRDRATATIVAIGFFAAGTALGRHADSAARATPLRVLFERHLARDEHQVFARIEGRLRSDGAKGEAGVTLSLAVDRMEIDGRAYVTSGGARIGVGGLAGDQILQWRAGRRVALPATLRRPARYLDPGVPDGERLMAWRGTALVGSVKSHALVEVIARGGVVSETFASARASVRRAVRASVGRWSERSAAIVLAILIGDRAGLSDATERRLQEAGTYHVIAISGGNIAILAGLCVLLLGALKPGHRVSAGLVIVVLAIYAFAIEGGSSVGRATLMAVIHFAARLCDHKTPPLNSAALAGAILMTVNPLQVVDPGFALTFGATLGILAGLPAIAGLFRSGWRRAPVALAAASVCAEIALLPVGALVFSRVTFAGLLVNFAAIPLMTVVQVAGMAAVAAWAAASTTAVPLGWVAHIAVEGLIGSAALVDWMPWLTRRLAPPHLVVAALYYVSVLTLLGFASRSTAAARARLLARPVAAAAFLVSSFWIVIAPPLGGTGGLLRVTFLDVGQGDAALVQFPNGRTLSVDAGGTAASSFDIAGRVISPAFWALGVRRLDYMSITHGDVDHIGGAPSLFRDFRPLEVWEGVPVPPHVPTRELRLVAETSRTTWRTLQPGDRMSVGPVNLMVHHPPIPDWERQRVRNDDSEVLEIRHGDVSFVFTGDISREVEHAIAGGFDPAPIRILKVPHHGSATSSSELFLDALRPDVAVISAGRGNLFGHPAPAVLDRYRNLGAAIYRTDHDGAVSVETDGTTAWVKTFQGRRLTLRAEGR